MRSLGFFSSGLGAATPPPDPGSNAVEFDGTNDYMVRGASLDGISDGKQGTLSVWLNTDVDGGTKYIWLMPNEHGNNFIQRVSGNTIRVFMVNNSDSSTILDASSTGTITAAAGWQHLLLSWDLATTSFHCYIDDTSGTSVTTNTNDTIDYTGTDFRVMSNGASNKWDGCVSEFWWTDEYLDLSVVANRRKFITAALAPVSLGGSGETPTGTAAKVYHNGDATNFQTNQGSGGGMSLTGALVNCATTPG